MAQVYDSPAASRASNLSYPIDMNNKLFFSAEEGSYGKTIWVLSGIPGQFAWTMFLPTMVDSRYPQIVNMRPRPFMRPGATSGDAKGRGSGVLGSTTTRQNIINLFAQER